MRSSEDSRCIGADSESSTGLQKGSGDEKMCRPCRAAKRCEMDLALVRSRFWLNQHLQNLSLQSLTRAESETFDAEDAAVAEHSSSSQSQLIDNSSGGGNSQHTSSSEQFDLPIESLAIAVGDNDGKPSRSEQSESRSTSKRTPPWKRPPVPLLPAECYATKAIILPVSEHDESASFPHVGLTTACPVFTHNRHSGLVFGKAQAEAAQPLPKRTQVLSGQLTRAAREQGQKRRALLMTLILRNLRVTS